MHALLRLYFVPYLRFYVSFHLVAIPLAALICILGIPELMMVTPFIYSFALYATSNRHQFKDNISWMISTFNKKTLLTYHFMSQGMLTLLMSLSSSLFFGLFLYLQAQKETSETVEKLTKVSAASKQVTEEVVASFGLGTKEEMILKIGVIFAFLVFFSPVSGKDFVRMRNTQTPETKKKQILGLLGAYLVLGVFFISGLDIGQWLLPVLSLLMMAMIFVFFHVFAKTFLLVHPKHYKKVMAGIGVMFFLTMIYHRHQSIKVIAESKNASEIVGELSFMGHFAPDYDEHFLVGVLRSLNRANEVQELTHHPRYKKFFTQEMLMDVAMKSQHPAVIMAVTSEMKDVKQLVSVWKNFDKQMEQDNKVNVELAKKYVAHFYRRGVRVERERAVHGTSIEKMLYLTELQDTGSEDYYSFVADNRQSFPLWAKVAFFNYKTSGTKSRESEGPNREPASTESSNH